MSSQRKTLILTQSEIERLLDSKAYAENWSRYWRDVIMMRATNQRIRLMQGSFERWMAEQLQDNVAWDKITTAMITAQGDVRENGDTALIFAHEAQATEVAAEVSRIFLGIQIQCANCHDHPTDKWKREQFHESRRHLFSTLRERGLQSEGSLIPGGRAM